MAHEGQAVNIEQASNSELQAELESLQSKYRQLGELGLKLDLTRGKPGSEQLGLSDALDGILQGSYRASDGTDVRNYGGIDGLPEAKRLFSTLLGTAPEQTLIGGNSSLTLMYHTLEFAMSEGVAGNLSAWGNADTVKFLCPSPGYDRHFAICEHLGIEMIAVPILDSGPDMDVIENLVREDASIKGIWCVPRFSNPTGCTYDDQTVERIAALGKLASENFLVMWDNAYAVHALSKNAPPLASIDGYCEKLGTADNVFQFGSTSKITFAGAGVAFLSSSEKNLTALKNHLAFQTIGPDKVNQLRHVCFLQNAENVSVHMAKHADILRPRFDSILKTLKAELAGTGMGSWTRPEGGYFVSFDSLPGLAKKIVQLADEVGVKLTPAGATYPYGDDPQDCNIRLAPSFPSLDDVQACVDVFVVCVKLASVQDRLAGS
ncbi:MAG: aminotransferase class I/II-fold pyridoxal phosphate-dependent enzyme [Proteobacteria bacterium]|nr:aminotransferase class I/II-fold pyridoxal phosphate-dependent enzyme [Pseudomonadota bacterium]